MGATGSPPAAASTRSVAFLAAAMVLLGVLLRLALLNGFGGTDDVTYAIRGLEIAQGEWRHSTSVTELRFGVSLPIAAASRLFGTSDLALMAWSLLCAALDIAAVCVVAGTFFGLRTALIAGLVMATVPLHIAMAGRALADAPFAAFTTFAFACFMGAVRRPSVLFSALAGVAAGVCWWIKPTASVPLFVALACYPLLLRRWDPRWWWTIVACAAVIVAEWLMLWARFGNPWLTLSLLLPFLREHGQYVGDPFWGEGSPWFYFRRMLLDGREMWLLPHLALLGALALVLRPPKAEPARFAGRYVLYWAASLLIVYSFFVISVSPVKFIPKQENYAVLFVAPLVLLCAALLGRLPRAASSVVLIAYAVGGLTLAGLQQQEVRAKFSRLLAAGELVRAEPGSAVVASSHTLAVATLRARQRHETRAPAALRPFSALDPRAVAPGTQPVQGAAPDAALASAASVLLVVERASSELALPAARSLLADVERCAQEVGRVESHPDGAGQYAVQFVAALRPLLPGAIDRQLAFTDGVLRPPTASIRKLGPGCPAPRS